MKLRKNRLILEFTEFNLQRFNSDNGSIATGVDNPQLSINAFDKHQDKIRNAIARVNDIMFNMSSTADISKLRSKLSLEEQDIQSLKILRIVKNNINYDAYITFVIDDQEYWGVIENVLLDPEVQSEVFKDYDLFQSKEWVIKTKGLIIKIVKNWLKPEKGIYQLINDELVCYSVNTGKMLKMEKGIEVELIRSYNTKIIINYNNEYYNLINDNFIYFNWWFEKVD